MNHDMFRIRRATEQDADIIAWHRARMFQDMGERLILHASEEGRAIYERLGFVASKEMRFGG
jgi:hypothetical protein